MEQNIQNAAINKKAERNSSVELLRIIAMVLIVLCHFGTQGKALFGDELISIPKLWWNFIELGGNLGTNVFVMISGYFLIKDKGPVFNVKRILKFWGQVFFYSAAFFVILSLKTGNFGLKSMIKALMPVTFNQWWFASTYFVLYLFHPFINKLIFSIDKSTFLKLIALLLFCWSVIPTLTTADYQSNPLLWFLCIYCVAAYVRIYGINRNLTSRHWFGLWIIFTVVTYASGVLLLILGKKWSFCAEHAIYFYGRQNILSLMRALCLFMTFVKLKMNYHKSINVIASATFGVFLIHAHGAMGSYMWEKIFSALNLENPNMIIPYSLAVSAIIFIVCTVIDLLRKYTIEKIYVLLVNKFADKIIQPIKKLYDAIVKAVTE